MPNLSIKNVPQDVVTHLRARARANHRSLQGELLDLACRAAGVADSVADPNAAAEQHMPGGPGGTKTIEQIIAEHIERRPQPVPDAPASAELIRRERDAR